LIGDDRRNARGRLGTHSVRVPRRSSSRGIGRWVNECLTSRTTETLSFVDHLV
jgi:hypothetical protein